jgi:uncharacterized protein involved in exopolysaccharide biosynthesis
MNQSTHTQVEVISLREVIDTFKKNKLRIVLITFLFGIIGVVVALLSPVEYKSETQLMPELESKGAGGLSKFGALASLAGINLDNMNTTDAVRPDLYPDILQSTPFMLHLLTQKVYSKKLNKELTLEQYFEQHSKKGWSLDIKKLWTKEDTLVSQDPTNYSKTLRVSAIQEKIIKDLKDRIITSLDRKKGIISINVKMPEPIIAATIARVSLEYLTDYVSDYRSQKNQTGVAFLTKQTHEARARYEQAQRALSAKKDHTLNFIMNVAQDQTRKLQNDVDLAFNIYNELSKRLEEAKIKKQEETPVIQILEPPRVPFKRSEPQRTLMVGAFILVGFILGCFYAIARIPFN